MAKTAKPKKDIKIRDLISYLFSPSNEIPEEFIIQEKNVKRYIIYLFEYIWHFPGLIMYFQKYNHLFNREIDQDPLGFLKFFKQVLKENNISSYQFKADFFNFYQELQKIKKLEEESAKQKRQLTDLITELKLAKIKNESVKLNEIKEIKKSNNDYIKETIKIAQDNKIKSIKQKKKEILKEITIDIIKENELTLIDVFIDEKHNQLVYTFLDKDFKKCYYLKKFSYDFYISKEFGIIKNDYLEEYNPQKFIKYSIYNFWDYNNLKRAININYKKYITQ